MSYRLEPNQPVIEAVRRIAHEQIDKAVRTIDDPNVSVPATVHDVRKRCKKLRGLIRLVRPGFARTYQQENAWFRDTARELSRVRDAKVMQGTYDLLMDHFADQANRSAFAMVRRALTVERAETLEQVPPEQLLQHASQRLRAAAERVDRWEIGAGGFKTIRGGLAKTYGRARSALSVASEEPSPKHMHELRKRVKYHWHHCWLLQGLWKPLIRARRHETKKLADMLGDDHDLAVLMAHVREHPGAFGDAESIAALADLIAQRRRQVQGKAIPLARRLLAETPDELSRRLRAYWKVWRAASARE